MWPGPGCRSMSSTRRTTAPAGSASARWFGRAKQRAPAPAPAPRRRPAWRPSARPARAASRRVPARRRTRTRRAPPRGGDPCAGAPGAPARADDGSADAVRRATRRGEAREWARRPSPDESAVSAMVQSLERVNAGNHERPITPRRSYEHVSRRASRHPCCPGPRGRGRGAPPRALAGGDRDPPAPGTARPRGPHHARPARRRAPRERRDGPLGRGHRRSRRGWLSAEQLDALRAAKQSYAPAAQAPCSATRRPAPRCRGVCAALPRAGRRSPGRADAGLRSTCAACPGRAGTSARTCPCTRTGRRGPGAGSRACPRRRGTY